MIHSNQTETQQIHTASRTRTSVTGLLRLLVTTTAQVVSASVDDNGAAEHALLANKLDKLVLHGANRVALGISLDVAQVTNVALVVGGSTVGLGEGVDWADRRISNSRGDGLI